jgi:pentatricopeptide repeat protein
MATPNVATWNAVLRGCAMLRHGKDALEHYEQMCLEGVEPDRVTFLVCLSACSHVAGLLDELGLCYFQSMGPVYSISATIELHASTVDLLGHAGHLYKAEDLVLTVTCGYMVTATVLESLPLVGTAIAE